MQLNLRKTALIAAIALSLVRGDWFVGQIRNLFSIPDFHWTYVAMAIGNFLFLLPLPVLLFILARSTVPIVVSKRLRYIALAAALAYSVLFTVPAIYSSFRVLYQDWKEILTLNGTTVADKIWEWFRNSTHVGDRFWATAGWLSQLAFVLFLFALYRNKDESRGGVPEQSQLLRTAAGITTALAASAVILTVFRGVYAAIEFSKRPSSLLWTAPTLGQNIAGIALLVIPEVCQLIPPYIIYKSQFQPLPQSPVTTEGVPA